MPRYLHLDPDLRASSLSLTTLGRDCANPHLQVLQPHIGTAIKVRTQPCQLRIAANQSKALDIYVKFDSMSGGEKALQGLNGRSFNNAQLDKTARKIATAV
jgi:hypothetical protein